MLLPFIALWIGLISSHSGKADRVKEKDLIATFVLISSDSLSAASWVESSLRRDVQRRDDDAVNSHRLSSHMSPNLWHQLQSLSSRERLHFACYASIGSALILCVTVVCLGYNGVFLFFCLLRAALHAAERE